MDNIPMKKQTNIRIAVMALATEWGSSEQIDYENELLSRYEKAFPDKDLEDMFCECTSVEIIVTVITDLEKLNG